MFFRRIARYIVVPFLIITCLFLTGIAMASTFVEPSRFIMALEPGGRTTGAINVTNTGEQEAELRAVVYDWTLGAQEELVLQDVGTREESLQGLIKFNPRRFTLGPGETQIVRFTIEFPKDGEGFERKGVVFFEQETTFTGEGMGASVITQVGSTIYVIPTTAQFAFRLLQAEVLQEQESRSATLTVRNEGTAHIRFTPKYKVIDSTGAVLEEASAGEKVILPGFESTLTVPLKTALSVGEYNLMLEVNFDGTSNVLSRTIPFVVN